MNDGSQPPVPPPQYASYPRGQQAQYGSADRLQALADGYFGLNWIFVLNVVIAWTPQLAALLGGNNGLAPILFLGGFVVVGLVIAFCTYPFNKKIGYGAGWSSAGPVVASTLMGINSALCCGIIGYVVMQQIALGEMKKYGLRVGFLGMRKRDVLAMIAQLRAAEQSPPPMQPMP